MEKKTFKIKTAILFIAFFINQSIFSQTTTGCWKTFTGGNVFAIGITTNGELWSWGYNNNGQLGQNNVTSRSSPVQVGSLATWSKVSCGGNFNLAIKADGSAKPNLRVKRDCESPSKKSSHINPYRKPTQVVKKNILRSSSDSWLRN